MNVQEQIAKLESLLDRVRRNAGRPHTRAEVTVAERAQPAVAPMTVAPVVEEAVPQSAMPPVARTEISAPPLVATSVTAPKPVSGPAVETTAEFEELDMMEAEIVELGSETDTRSAPSAAPPAGKEYDLGAPTEEEAPKSAPRPARDAARHEEREPEVPIKTPPPESGPQIMAVTAAPAVTYREEVEAEEADLAGSSDVDALLEADLSGGPISKAPSGVPTMEQLGDTVELEGADEPPAGLELDAPAPPYPAAPAPVDELELTLPKAEFGGGYDPALAPPAQASDDLERHDREIEAIIAPAPASRFGVSVPPSGPVAVTTDFVAPASVIPIVPLLMDRPIVADTHVAHIIAAAPAKMPDTFLELLDASLAL